jgi:hypothetical protein
MAPPSRSDAKRTAKVQAGPDSFRGESMIARGRSFVSIALVAAAVVAAACATDGPTAPGGTLAGLNQTTTNNGTAPGDTNPPAPGPGYFRGTVIGQSAPGAGNDSLATAPRIAGVRVTIYDMVRSETGVRTDTERGSVVTDASGQFTLPTLPGGDYIVTFVPAAGSAYHGVYAFGPLNQNSSLYPWWITLPKN